MEEVGAPIFIHQTLPNPLCDGISMTRKRDLAYRCSSNYPNQNQSGNWNPNFWNWDTVGLVAKPNEKKKDVASDDDGLCLKLGDGPNSDAGPVSRPNKRVCSGSPGSTVHPVCQVDDCKEDLSKAKDYHRRHKVCQLHSKCTKSRVANQIQRFCQQCSRFHLLSEFDEGKRSCRRRLAGHNKRRRKTQSEDVAPQVSLFAIKDKPVNGNLDIVNLLGALARVQDNSADNISNCASVPDRDRLIQILGKLTFPSGFPAKSLISTSGRNISEQASLEQHHVLNGNASTSSAPLDSQSGDSRKTVPNFVDSDCRVHEASPNLPLQLFSSSLENLSPPILESSRKYFSSDSSDPMEDKSFSGSPPVVQKLFPMQTLTETSKSQRTSFIKEANDCSTSLQLFKEPSKTVDSGSFQNFPHQADYTSSSRSDHSRSSLNSDARDRTGRIIFKLFDKDPSHFPKTLREQIYKWISHSPSEIEGYIRPGCVILSIYVSMLPAAWEQLEENVLQNVSSLIYDSDSDFWRNARFLIHTGRKLVSHKDGKIRLCKRGRTWKTPEIVSVSPLAIVGGEETCVVLRGRNLTTLGTRIHYTNMGGYITKEVSDMTHKERNFDEINIAGFKVQEAPSDIGRCFIEVENGLNGSCFPIIIANASICKELRLLESEFSETIEDRTTDCLKHKPREETVHFLNELGWLFQRKKQSRKLNRIDNAPARFKYLISFSVERDCCVLVKTLVDMYILDDNGLLRRESVEALLEINLLNRAVEQRSRNMVEMLVDYSVSIDGSKDYIFRPNYVGRCGISPLHLAACLPGSDDVVNALTGDPQEIGLSCWNSLLDANGLSPYDYALMRNHHSYNRAVAVKLADRSGSQITISIKDENAIPIFRSRAPTCARCAIHSPTLIGGRNVRSRKFFQRPSIHFMIGIAAVCAGVCLLFRALPHGIKLESISHGAI